MILLKTIHVGAGLLNIHDKSVCADSYLSSLCSPMDKIPLQYRASAKIRSEETPDYGGPPRVETFVTYQRPYTDAETEEHSRAERSKAIALRTRERAELKRLQEKYRG